MYMRSDCDVCRSEGFTAHSRVLIETDEASGLATLNVVRGELLKPGEAGLSESAWERLANRPRPTARFSHAPTVASLRPVRAKIHGRTLEAEDIAAIVNDIAAGRYTDVEIAALLTACTSAGMTMREVVALTHEMVAVGERLHWDREVVADKHCVGGLPGNRTTPIVVAIVAARGVCIPKTSSRAITSPAGTADTVATMAPVNLDLSAMRNVVDRHGGCLVWGGSVQLSPVDDTLIRVERALDIDSEAQLVASILSKKVAAGSTHVVIDIPVGPSAKVRDPIAASALSRLLTQVAREFGLELRVVLTDGSQPVGRGIGPALEARDVLAVMRCDADAPEDLRRRAVTLAGEVLEAVAHCPRGAGGALAEETLQSGIAWRKLQAILEAQGGMREPPVSGHRWDFLASAGGTISAIDNRRLARAAKLAGAPSSPAAGIRLLARLGDEVQVGQTLFELHAETPGELAYARSFFDANRDLLRMTTGP